MKSKKLQANKKSIFAIIFNLAAFVLGLCLLLWANKVSQFISIALGLGLIFVAAYYVIDFISDKNREDSDGEISKIIAAVALALLGLFLIIQKDFISNFISIVVGLGLSISGLTGLHRAIELKHFSPDLYIRPLISAIICILCGALCILGKLIVTDFMFQILGTMLMIYAVVSTYGILMTSKLIKAEALSKEDSAVEAEIVTKSENSADSTDDKANSEADSAETKKEQKEQKKAEKKATKAQKQANKAAKEASKAEKKASKAKKKAEKAEQKASKN